LDPFGGNQAPGTVRVAGAFCSVWAVPIPPYARGGLTMNGLTLSFIAVAFFCGATAGYLFREGISRARRRRAREWMQFAHRR
jgi:hypothetical protein